MILSKKFSGGKNSETFQKIWFDEENKNLQRERRFASANWSAYSKLRSKLSSVVKEKEERFSWNCFISLKSSKDRWNFINNVRGQNQSGNIAVVKNSFEELIVDDKKIAELFNFIFSNLGKYFGREHESAPLFKAGDESFRFCPITEKGCYDILKQINPHKTNWFLQSTCMGKY